MENIGLNQLREMFLSFYESKEHYRKNSFSLVPENDKSLLIINSGMAPLKPYFSGVETPPAVRMTTCQKCIRTGDIEIVGLTARHGTFFEMLGSFSFGEYFKKESLLWGWEFITEVLKMPEDKLWATIYLDDDQAYDIWVNDVGISPERVVRLGKDDNFWEIGTGPCGPCSEVYFDRGPEYGCDNPDCKPGCDCDRYLEFWNHVFTQFDRQEDGTYVPLAKPNIDTGMGLERLACLMQGVDSIFDVDTIHAILDEVVRASGVKYCDGKEKTDISIRVITDHMRSVTHMISDGILPSNEGRGYVLRRLFRRAARHAKILGIDQKNFLADLSGIVIDESKSAYPKLEENRAYIRKIITVENDKFAATIDQGNNILLEYIDELKKEGKTVLDGEKSFKLYDTYGFPLELTQEILEENGCTADAEGFAANMENQRNVARAARKNMDEEGWKEASIIDELDLKTEFVGYNTLESEAEIVAIIKNNEAVGVLKAGETAFVALDKTPFYAESGGQVGDKGTILAGSAVADVSDVVKAHSIFMHKVTVKEGELKTGDTVSCSVEHALRNATARNHTATHLLHRALRNILGEHVHQAGSSVTESGLRFDFTHFEAISKEDIQKIENIVNNEILRFTPLCVEEMQMDEAVKMGATALFGEKYGDIVRVVSVGDFTVELCGGTHVQNSGQIGAFKILSEAGVAAGVRRIEAITGTGILQYSTDADKVIGKIAELLKTNNAGVVNKLVAVLDEGKAVKKELEDFKKNAMTSGLDDMLADAYEAKGIKLLTKHFKDYNINDLRALSDSIKSAAKGVIMVFATENDGKVTFMVSVTDDLLDKGYHAGNMIKQIAGAAGGGGGGKADMAQAGAKEPSKIPAAFEVAKSLL